MKRTKLIAPSVLGCLLLAACGGGGGGGAPVPTEAAIGGTVSGWSSGPSSRTLLLNNSGSETIAVTTDGPFSFPKRVGEGNPYNVKVLYQPNGFDCVVANGSGTVIHGVDSVPPVSVTCSPSVAIPLTMFYVGVTVSGLLPGNSVTFLKNGVETLTATGDGLFVFQPDANSGLPTTYDVIVKTAPDNQSCTVTDGSGTLSLPVVNSYLVNIPASCK